MSEKDGLGVESRLINRAGVTSGCSLRFASKSADSEAWCELLLMMFMMFIRMYLHPFFFFSLQVHLHGRLEAYIPGILASTSSARARRSKAVL